MAGYTRQSSASIVNGSAITAPPLNAEFNQLLAAFNASSGHIHNGTTGNGAYVPLIADVDALNKIVVNTSTNQIGVFVQVSSSTVEQLRFSDGAIIPVTDNDIDLGTSSLEFKDLYLDGTAHIDTLDVDINGAVAGTFTIGSTLGVTGVTTLGTANISTGNITSVDINSGAIDNVTIGGTTAGVGSFTTLNASGTSTLATVDIGAGAIDGTIIGANTAAAATVTALTASGTSTLSTVDINGGAIDGTTIGASSAAAGSFTTVVTSGQATLASVDINGGNIDGAIIGASATAAITGTTITGSSFVGPLTGNVSGNTAGVHTGNVTGNVTGNISASSGTSTLNNLTVNGTLDVTGTTIANVTDPTNAQDAATKNYVDTEVSALVDSSPSALNTLNELAAAINDDASFSTTITNSIATKLPLAGGTMSGAIAMGTSKITGLGNPTANQDASTKAYVDSTALLKAGGTMSGVIAMGSNKITGLTNPTANQDAATKAYVDSTSASNTAAAASASAASTSENNAASSATSASNSASAASSSATSAAASFDSFDDRYLGAKSSAPSVDNDNNSLIPGALYFNTSSNIMFVRSSAGGWQAAGSSVNGTSSRNTYTANANQTTFSATYDAGYVDIYLNGVKLLVGTDVTASNGSTIVLATGATAGDIVDIVGYGTFELADHYNKTAADARFLGLAGGTMTGDINGNGNKVLFGNVYSQVSDLPSASTYHGMFAHVHATGKGYFAHAGNWVALANDTEKLNLSGGTMTGNLDVGGSVEFDSLSGTGSVSITDILDEDNMASNSATALATQQSIKAYTDTSVANLIDSSPSALNTLNELAAALGDDASFSTTVTNSIATKLPLSGGTMTGNISHAGNFTLDVAGDITLDADGREIKLKDAGLEFGVLYNSNGDFGIYSSQDDKDMLFQGSDGGSVITALTLDMSNAGAATFNSTVTANNGINVDNINIDGTTIALSSGNLTLDVAGDIILDADGAEVFFADGGTNFLKIQNDSGTAQIRSLVSDGDIQFIGSDNGSAIVALTLDMSDAGTAIFNNKVGIDCTPKTPLNVVDNNNDDNLPTLGAASGVLSMSNSANQYGLLGGVQQSSGHSWLQAQRTDGVSTAYNILLNPVGGKIGIGESSPSAKLEIGGMAAGEQGLLIESGRNDALSNGLARINITDSNCPFAGLQIDHAGTGAAIIANGNVLVGSTNNSPATNNVAGSSHGSLGNIQASVAGNPCLFVNRKSNDGDIISLRKDGSAVGSLSVWNGHIGLVQGGTRLEIDDGNDVVFFTNNSNGGLRDNTTDIGKTNARIKNVHAVNFHGNGSNLTGVGGSTAFGAVGTYVAAAALGDYTGGQTVSGSSLRRNTAQTGNNNFESQIPNTTSYGLSGTWRAMGMSDDNQGQSWASGNLWVRIS